MYGINFDTLGPQTREIRVIFIGCVAQLKAMFFSRMENCDEPKKKNFDNRFICYG